MTPLFRPFFTTFNLLQAARRKKRRMLVVAAFSLLLASCQLFDAQKSEEISVTLGLFANDYSLAKESQFIEQLIEKMTLREKVAQMIQAEIRHITPQQVKEYGIGSVLNGGGSFPNRNKHASTDDWREITEEFYNASISRSSDHPPIALLWGTDAVHGHNNLFGATLFPHNIGLGAANNPELTHAIAEATAEAVRSTGIKWVFAPTVAVARNDRWGRTYESYSEDPSLVSKHASATVLGLQGIPPAELQSEHRVIATAKHFIGDGGTRDGIDQGDTLLSEEQLLHIHGQSFYAALNTGVQVVMASFNSWNGDKVHGSSYLLTKVLKNRMAFDGFVIGDWNGHAQIPGCSKDSCATAINAGVDMLMAPEHWQQLLNNTVAQVEDGTISSDRINDAVTRILRVKYRAGLFNTEQKLWTRMTESTGERHRQLARRAVRESMVLLKNNNQTLPVAANSKILVVGGAANSIARQAGGWSLTWQGDGNSNADFPNGSTILQGVEQALTSQGGKVIFDPTGQLVETLPALETIDHAIFVFGEAPYAEGAGDLDKLRPPYIEYQYLSTLEKLRQKNIPITTVMLTGRPLSTNAFINASDAFVVAWLPGTEGAGIADVLIGDTTGQPRHDFKGKLAFSWPRSDQQSSVNNYPAYEEQPQFAVGYGLSYSNGNYVALLEEVDNLKGQRIAVNEPLNIFVKTVLAPWGVYVGDEENWSVVVNGNRGSTQNNKTVVVSATDNVSQEDARLIKWQSAQRGQFYFQHSDSMDLSELAEKGAALKFKVRVQKPPQNTVAMRMDCGFPCTGEIDVTELLRSMPKQEWQSVAIDLHCFAQKGAELKQIDTPFLISTSGDMALEISNVMIEPEAGETRRMDCSHPISQVLL